MQLVAAAPFELIKLISLSWAVYREFYPTNTDNHIKAKKKLLCQPNIVFEKATSAGLSFQANKTLSASL